MLVQALGNLVSFLKRHSSRFQMLWLRNASLDLCWHAKVQKAELLAFGRFFDFILGPYVDTKNCANELSIAQQTQGVILDPVIPALNQHFWVSRSPCNMWNGKQFREVIRRELCCVSSQNAAQCLFAESK